MKKDLNWFKEQLDDIEMNTPRLWSHNSIWMLDRVNELLNQLDEPEVLSHKWVSDNTVVGQYPNGMGYVVPAYRLRNLLVPKQEEVKEQKYNVKFKIKSSSGEVGVFLYKKGDEVLAGDNFKAYKPDEEEFKLTEQEIIAFQNGDMLFEHFAVKVEELEE